MGGKSVKRIKQLIVLRCCAPIHPFILCIVN